MIDSKIINLIDKSLSNDEKIEFLNISKNIITHSEFLRRCTSEFMHHNDVTVGMHIMENAIRTYKRTKKLQKKGKKVSTEYAVIIALCHDLYCVPWQNSKIKKEKFINKHGFTHPIEAALNALYWFPEIFDDDTKTKIIMDGIIHHMFPFPVRKIDETNLELNNEKLLLNVDYIKLLSSLTDNSILKLSLRPSRYKEGRTVSIEDKIVTMKDYKKFEGITSLVTGRNKKLLNQKM